MTRTRHWTRLMTGVAVLLLLGAACANDDGSDAGAQTGADGTTAPTGPTGASPTAEETSGDDTGGYGDAGGEDDSDDESGGGGADADVQANNFAFSPTELEIEAGEDIHVKNGNANTPHTFTVEGTDIDLRLDPLEVEEARIDLDPGDYGFHCELHPQMTGTLTVI
jgi:plastocyanin